jgi:hypothetical protein
MINRLQLVTWFSFSFAFACTREQTAALPPAPVDRSGPLEIEWGDRVLEPSEVVPRPSGGPPCEPDNIGWSRNSSEFMFCVNGGGSDCSKLCDFHRVGSEPEHVDYGDAEPEQSEAGEVKICDQPLAAFEHRLAVGDFRIENGDWAYGADVVLVVAETKGEPDNEGMPRGIVQIGARLRSAGASVAWVETIEECDEGYCAPDVHIDAIAPSPDGQTIAVLVHSNAGEFLDTYPLRLLDARTLADAAYKR